MAIPTVYRLDDPGAPSVHGNTPGSLKDWFKKALVEGYGAKAGAGWTVLYEDTNKAAFQSATNAQGYSCVVRVDDSATTGNRQALIQTYSSMTDIDTGESPTETVRASRNPGSTSTMAPLEGFIVADNKRFYASARSESGGAHTWMLGAGFASSFSTGDAFGYFSFGQHATNDNVPPNVLTLSTSSSSYNLIGATPNSNIGLSLGRAYTGLGGVSPAGLLRAGSGGASNQYVGGNAFIARPSLNGASEAALPAIIVQNDILRGRLPGLYLPLADCRDFGWMNTNTTAAFGGPGSELMLLEAGNVTRAGIWVETALDWGD